jgi:AraC family transcriptional regulator
MEPRIEIYPARIVVGMVRSRAGAAGARGPDEPAEDTASLWRRFMPRLDEIESRVGSALISMRIFRRESGGGLTPHTPYEEWAAVEVSEAARVPDGMMSATIPEGMYAVFIHSGPPSTFPETVRHIFGRWLPSSDFELADRPHLAVMPADYRPDDPNAREEIHVPVARGIETHEEKSPA